MGRRGVGADGKIGPRIEERSIVAESSGADGDLLGSQGIVDDVEVPQFFTADQRREKAAVRFGSQQTPGQPHIETGR